MPVMAPVKESIKIPEGKHKGKIARLDVRTEPFSYLDVWVALDDVKDSQGKPVQLKDGNPLTVSKNSKLGRLLKRFGMTDLEIKQCYGSEVDVERWLKAGTGVELMTINKAETGGFEFARIVEDSLKPVD